MLTQSVITSYLLFVALGTANNDMPASDLIPSYAPPTPYLNQIDEPYLSRVGVECSKTTVDPPQICDWNLKDRLQCIDTGNGFRWHVLESCGANQVCWPTSEDIPFMRTIMEQTASETVCKAGWAPEGFQGDEWNCNQRTKRVCDKNGLYEYTCDRVDETNEALPMKWSHLAPCRGCNVDNFDCALNSRDKETWKQVLI